MVICCGCGDPFAAADGGLMIKPVVGVASPKSGRSIPNESTFPDGSREKFLCNTCCFSATEVGVVVGIYDTGYDFPHEKEVHPGAVSGVFPTYQLGSGVHKN